MALDQAVVALGAAAGHEVEPAVERREQLRDLLGLVLAVGVHQHDDVAGDRVEAGCSAVDLP